MDNVTLFCIVIPIIIIVAWVVIRTRQADAFQRELSYARDAYAQALAALRKDPGSGALREKALAVGRTYANYTRQKKGVTVFDEVALMNDINAIPVPAPAPVPVSAAPVPPPSAHVTRSVAERLRQLDELKGQGLIDEAEYQDRRRKILDDV